MFDDRKDSSAGVKFKDAELIGIPFILVVGKGLAEGKVELKIRKSGEKKDISVSDAISELEKLISNA